MKKINSLFTIAVLALMLCCTSAFAKDKLKVGGTNFKVRTEGLSTVIVAGNDFTLSVVGTKGTKVGTATLIFKDLKDQIVSGAEFDVTTGQDFQSGKVNINVSGTQTTRSGKSTVTSTDEESAIRSGKVRITKVSDDGSFTVSFKAKASSPLIQKSNPLRGQVTPTESRGKNLSFSGQVSTSFGN